MFATGSLYLYGRIDKTFLYIVFIDKLDVFYWKFVFK